MNKEELNTLAREIRESKNPKSIPIRIFLEAFGFQKRTCRNLGTIDSWLEQNDLKTNPDYKNEKINSSVNLQYAYNIKSNNFQLYYLKIEKYKNLINFSVDFEKTNGYCCFIGLNGSGKSNVLEAVSRIFYSLYRIATLTDGLRRYPCGFSYTIRYILNGNLYEVRNGVLKDGNRITLDVLPKNIIASYSGEDTRLWELCYKPLYENFCSRMVATQGFAPPFLFYLSKNEWEISLLTLLYSEDIDVVKYINGLIGNASCKISFEYNDSNSRKWEGTEVGAFVEKLKEKAEYNVESFRSIVNEISFIEQASTLFYCLYKCRTDGNYQIIKKINIDFGEKGTIDDLSEGEKKLINANVVIHVLSSNDSLCLFDEPDAHVHVGRQRELKKLINSENRYSFVTTHSPVLLDLLYNDCNICYLNEGKVLDVDKLNQINSLTNGEVNYFEGSFILSSKKILVTEGKYDGKYLKKAIEIFSKEDSKYNRLNDVAFIQAGGASNAVAMFNETLKSSLPQYEKIVVLFDYDSAGFDGWKEINNNKGTEGKVEPLFYQLNYANSYAEKPDLENTVMVEDLFSEDSYKEISQKVHVRTHKAFRNIKWGRNIKSTADAIKDHIEKNYLTFEDVWFNNFKPVLDKLLEVFALT